MPTRVRSHAKINLGLGIGARRADGYHGLATIYQTLEMYDIVTVSARRAAATALRLTSNDSRVPCDKSNTACKIAALALDALGIAAEVDLHIEKRLPVQGGLGAGSANAVAALVGLERELGFADGPRSFRDASFGGSAPEGWGATRLELAAQVGSDVPLFLLGGTVLGLDRGQRVRELPDLGPVWCVVAAPETGVSTPQAFRDWDALCAGEGLTPEASTDKLIKLSRAYLSAFGVPTADAGPGSSGVFAQENRYGREDLAGPQESELVRTGITGWMQNDFERVVFPQHLSLAAIKCLLAAAGTPVEALYASLSGSGSALFGLYRSRRDAEAAADRIDRQTLDVEVRCTLTRTLPRSDYWRQMILS